MKKILVSLLACFLALPITACANDYYNHTGAFTAGSRVRSADMNAKFNAIEDGFDDLPAPHAGAPATKGFSEVFKIVDGTANDHPVSVGQVQDGSLVYNTATGTNTYALDLTPNVTAYTAGQVFCFKPQNNNTGAATLNVDTLGAKAIKDVLGAALTANTLDADGIYCAAYDGTDFALLGAGYNQSLNATDSPTFVNVTSNLTGNVTGNLTGNVTGNTSGTAATVTGAAQSAITSLGTLTALTVDNLTVDGNTINANSGALNLTPASGSALVLDGTINVDAGVVTGATSITSTTFVGALTGNASTATSATSATTSATTTGYGNTQNSTNVSSGYQGLSSITSGTNNTVYGYSAGSSTTSGGNNLFAGTNSGKTHTTGSNNVFLGNSAGYSSTSSNSNIFMGSNAGYNNINGSSNVIIGSSAGFTNSSSSNVFIGTSAGYSNNSYGNVFIGNQAGYSETGNSKLYIDSSSTATPLIHGDFSTNALTINGTLKSTGRLNIPTYTPATAAAACTTGDMAWDASYIYICTSTNAWKRGGIATW